jgi:CheY-like chemotaxis protein
LKRNKVLIVDDESDVISALQFRLASSGYETITAANGAEALEILRKTEVDLVLADFMMPEVNGLELTRLVRENPSWYKTKILLFSCNLEPRFRRRAIELGAIDYIPKTDGASHIARRVAEVLAPHDAARSSPAQEEEGAHGPGPSTYDQLRTLSQNLLDLLHLASMENDLPPATKYALNASSRLAEDIRSLAEADQTNEEREKAAS